MLLSTYQIPLTRLSSNVAGLYKVWSLGWAMIMHFLIFNYYFFQLSGYYTITVQLLGWAQCSVNGWMDVQSYQLLLLWNGWLNYLQTRRGLPNWIWWKSCIRAMVALHMGNLDPVPNICNNNVTGNFYLKLIIFFLGKSHFFFIRVFLIFLQNHWPDSLQTLWGHSLWWLLLCCFIIGLGHYIKIQKYHNTNPASNFHDTVNKLQF